MDRQGYRATSNEGVRIFADQEGVPYIVAAMGEHYLYYAGFDVLSVVEARRLNALQRAPVLSAWWVPTSGAALAADTKGRAARAIAAAGVRQVAVVARASTIPLVPPSRPHLVAPGKPSAARSVTQAAQALTSAVPSVISAACVSIAAAPVLISAVPGVALAAPALTSAAVVSTSAVPKLTSAGPPLASVVAPELAPVPRNVSWADRVRRPVDLPSSGIGNAPVPSAESSPALNMVLGLAKSLLAVVQRCPGLAPQSLGMCVDPPGLSALQEARDHGVVPSAPLQTPVACVVDAGQPQACSPGRRIPWTRCN